MMPRARLRCQRLRAEHRPESGWGNEIELFADLGIRARLGSATKPLAQVFRDALLGRTNVLR